ncbi:uncharacterized protein LTR77_000846 [Saxophila tyrrhenica]|uniref:Uncharacterized protein n=1 Tax=Saxophila tyrrhenica TaxID=1690608 RepID=A0AAV9PSB0_9PEZI|nr:hypothetical protein LTR77_000846 [Saxophila tyrrhenica]
MKPTAILAAALSLASSTLAAPTSRPVLQSKIQTLEIQILNIVNDIVQSSSTLQSDYSAGILQFNDLANELQGPLPCAPFVPGRPSTKKQAITALQSSQEGLMMLSLDLQDPELKAKKGDFHGDVCVALDWYAAVSEFVGV